MTPWHNGTLDVLYVAFFLPKCLIIKGQKKIKLEFIKVICIIFVFCFIIHTLDLQEKSLSQWKIYLSLQVNQQFPKQA